MQNSWHWINHCMIIRWWTIHFPITSILSWSTMMCLGSSSVRYCEYFMKRNLMSLQTLVSCRRAAIQLQSRWRNVCAKGFGVELLVAYNSLWREKSGSAVPLWFKEFGGSIIPSKHCCCVYVKLFSYSESGIMCAPKDLVWQTGLLTIRYGARSQGEQYHCDSKRLEDASFPPNTGVVSTCSYSATVKVE